MIARQSFAPLVPDGKELGASDGERMRRNPPERYARLRKRFPIPNGLRLHLLDAALDGQGGGSVIRKDEAS